jgi:predicted nuclease with TOPRIM domain
MSASNSINNDGAASFPAPATEDRDPDQKIAGDVGEAMRERLRRVREELKAKREHIQILKAEIKRLEGVASRLNEENERLEGELEERRTSWAGSWRFWED